MRETVQGVKRVGPRRSNVSPLPCFLSCRFGLDLAISIRDAVLTVTRSASTASGGPSRTPQPAGCAVKSVAVNLASRDILCLSLLSPASTDGPARP